MSDWAEMDRERNQDSYTHKSNGGGTKFDIGNIITIVVLIFGMAVGWGKVQGELDNARSTMIRIETKVDSIDRTVDGLKTESIKRGEWIDTVRPMIEGRKR